MNVFTVSLFGHREIEDLSKMEKFLIPIVKELICTKQYVTFLIGRNGEFDEFAASIIKQLQKEYGNENNDMILVLPYKVADIEYYEKYYDSVLIPADTYGVHPKAVITVKNRWMIDRSDLVIFYVNRSKGGAYAAMKYAEKLNKDIINICEG
ncbi:MAG: hypothetical protein E7665_00470 [Ruminococcaceae bacterium]|nr:hypothetical protein [Oscillospiraceae bacterium]